MNSEVYFEGKKYISVKKASQLTSYSRDYIGQLCRGNKIISRRIDRGWYVSEESILNYKTTPKTEFSNIEKINNDNVSRPAEILNSLQTKDFSANRKSAGLIFNLSKIALLSVFTSFFIVGLLSIKSEDIKNTSEAIKAIPSKTYSIAKESTDFYASNLSLVYLQTGEVVIRESNKIWENPLDYLATSFNKILESGRVGTNTLASEIKDLGTSSKVGVRNFISEQDKSSLLALVFDPFESSSSVIYSSINNFIDKKIYSPLASLFGNRPVVVSPVYAVDRKKSEPVVLAQSNSIPTPVSSPRIITNTVVERIVERVIVGDVTRAYVDLSLQQLKNNLTAEFSKLSVGSGGAVTNIYQQLAHTQKIDNLYNTAISNPTITGGSITNTSVSATSGSFTSLSTPSLSVAGSATISSLSVTGTSVNSILSLDANGLIVATSTPTFGNFNATSTTATSTISTGGLTIGDNHFLVQQNSGRIGIGTTTPQSLLELFQTTNGLPILSAYRNTDSAPTGDFINFRTKAGTTLFRVDNSGNLLAGGIITTGSQTITSVSTPQFRLQYDDSSNEITFSTNSVGSTTIAVNGSNSSLNFIPQNNQVNAFNFQNAAGTSILNIDSTNSRVGIGTTSPFALLSVAGSGFFNGNLTATNITATGTISVTGLTTLVNASTTQLSVSNTAYFPGSGIWNSSGNVGIGTVSPVSALEIGSGVLTLPAGTVSAPSLRFANGADTGIYSGAAGQIYFSRLGLAEAKIAGGLSLESASLIRWSASGIDSNADVLLKRSAANTLHLSNDGASGAANLIVTGNVGIGTTSPWARLSADTASLAAGVPSFVVGSSTRTDLVVTQSGNVGIGTVSPGAQLQVNAGAAGIIGSIIKGATSQTANLQEWQNSDGTVLAKVGNDGIVYVKELRKAGGYLDVGYFDGSIVYTGANGHGMLGFSTPATPNYVHAAAGSGTGGGAAGGLALNVSSSLGWSTSNNAMTGATDTALGRNAAGIVEINNGTSGTFRDLKLRNLETTGNVGIGTTTPFGKLSIHANNGETNFSLFNIGSSTASATTTLFTVLNNGNVGIGTIGDDGSGSKLQTNYANQTLTGNLTGSSAAAKHHIGAYTTNTQGIDVGASLGLGGFYESANTYATFGAIAGRKIDGSNNNTKGYLSFLTNSSGVGLTEKMRIDDVGNVGIGTASPIGTSANGFTQDANSRGLEVRSVSNSGYSNLYVRNASGNVGLDITSDAASSGSVYFDSRYDTATTDGGFLFRTKTAGTATNAVKITGHGSVGIGTLTPGGTLASGMASGSKVLEIIGNSAGIFLRAANLVVGIDMWSQNSGDNYIDSRYDNADAVTVFRGRTAGTPVNIMTLKNTGNVGIGTTTPFGKLSIHANNGETNFSLFNIGSSTASATTTLFTVLNNGNVGIGTAVPGATLDVVGAGVTNSTIRIDAIRAVVSDQNNGSVAGYFDSGTANNAFSLKTGQGPISFGSTGISNLTLNGWINQSSVHSATLGNVTIGDNTSGYSAGNGGNLVLAGDTLSQGTANTTFANIRGIKENGSYNNSLGALVFGTQANSGSQQGLSTVTEKLRITSTGNVGIGTTTPWARLSADTSSLASGVPSFVVGSSTRTDLVVTQSGNVGIGTTVPGQKLEVQGNVKIGDSSNGYFLSIPRVTSLTDGASLLLHGNTDTSWGLGSTFGAGAGGDEFHVRVHGSGTADNKRQFQVVDSGSSNAVRFAVSFGTGNVGIGTTSPWAKLSVNTGSLSAGVPSFVVGSSTRTDLVVTQSGNVGIGTTSPEAKLHLTNAASGIEFLVENSAEFAAKNAAGTTETWMWPRWSDNIMYTNFGSSGWNIRNKDSTNVMFMQNGGNVGIGTTDPSTNKLVVVGDIRVGTSGTNGCVERFDGAALTGSCSSDIRLKQNIIPFSNVLDKFVTLQPVNYNWRSSEFPERHFGTSTVAGLIAQEVEQIFPNLVGVNDKGFKTVDYGINLQMLTIQAVKELNLKVDSLASSTPETGSFGERVMTNIFMKITSWLASATNGIGDFFANRVRTKELCVGSTCVTEEQFLAMVNMAQASGVVPTQEESLDISSPVITVNGDNPASISVGTSYSDLGATVTDIGEGGIVNNNLGLHFNVNGLDVQQISIDTSATSTHTIIYSAVDGAGNWGYATRTVEVVE